MAENYVLLETIELTQSAASVTFDNIPQTGYTDLKVVMSVSGDWSGSRDCYISFNGSTSTFTGRYVEGTGSAPNAGTVARYLGTITVATANTFASGEVYVANYLSGRNKSFTSDFTGEANQTTAYATLAGGLWSTASAITSIGISPSAGNFIANSTFSLYGVAALGTTPTFGPFASGGSIIENDGTYWYHTFLSSGIFTPAKTLTCDYLVVAGGGGGGRGAQTRGGGGGGAGGFRTVSSATLASSTAFAVVVGGGGSRGIAQGPQPTSGSDSVFNSTTSTGGGRAGFAQEASALQNGAAGGSGGGATGEGGVVRTGGAGNTPATSPSQGNSGGNSNTNASGGGGGGASSSGGDASGASGGSAGSGTANSISGSSVTYAVGGAGGAVTGSTVGTSGTANRGNGGNGAQGEASTNNGVNGGNGGSGIVIVRYAMV